MASSRRVFDVVVYGATGFTGGLTAQYLQAATARPGFRWAIAGRSEKKLRAFHETNRLGDDVGIIVADSADGPSLREMTSQCKAVASTVGPYLKYGHELVAACVATRTHYCDLTGEPPFVREMVDLHHDEAVANGVKIVNCCGYDCVPIDLAVMMALEEIQVPGAHTSLVPSTAATASASTTTVRALFTKMNGLMSGGTAASSKLIMEWAKKPANQLAFRDPYYLAPTETSARPELRVDERWTDKAGLGYDSNFGTLSMPYFMAVVDNRLVRRSLCLRGQAASFDEALSIGAAGRMAAFAATHLPSFIGLGMSPKPGEGPSPSVQRDGGFSFEVCAKTVTRGDGGEGAVECRVAGEGIGDPGYAATSVMLAECAICLSQGEASEGTMNGGVLTPSVAMGRALVRRLEKTGRFKFERTRLQMPVSPAHPIQSSL